MENITWSDPVAVSASADGVDYLSAAQSGDVLLIAWSDEVGVYASVGSVTSKTFASATELLSGLRSSTQCKALGDVFVVAWMNVGAHTVEAAVYDGTSWTEAETISTDGHWVLGFRLVNNDGGQCIVWATQTNELHYRTLSSGTWTAAQQLSGEGDAIVRWDVAGNDDGTRCTAVYSTSSEGVASIAAYAITAAAPALIASRALPNGLNQYKPFFFRRTSSSNGMLVYCDDDGDLMTSRLNITEFTDPIVVKAAGDAPVDACSLALSGSNAWYLYVSTDGGFAGSAVAAKAYNLGTDTLGSEIALATYTGYLANETNISAIADNAVVSWTKLTQDLTVREVHQSMISTTEAVAPARISPADTVAYQPIVTNNGTDQLFLIYDVATGTAGQVFVSFVGEGGAGGGDDEEEEGGSLLGPTLLILGLVGAGVGAYFGIRALVRKNKD